MQSLEHTSEDVRHRLRGKFAIPAKAAASASKKGIATSVANRARQEVDGHPTTSEILYTEPEMEFMMAVRAYQERTGRKFPTTRELLYVMFSLGYRKD